MTAIRPGVAAKNRTHAALAAQHPQPPRRYSQAELRERRRTGFTAGHYGGDWSLAREIADVVGPLAQRIAADERPSRFMRSSATVPWLAEMVHEAVGVVVGWVAEADARRRTAHLANEPGKRRYAVTTLVDLATRPALPEITDKMLKSGAWAAALVAMADGIDDAFSDLLTHSHPPNAAALRGQPSRSEHLARLLRETIDRAALALERRLNRDDHGDHHPTGETASTPDDRARAELESLGVTP
ncbi:hypothetical protein MDOR_24610 [Mycolicibacterium doricum]|uniref:Uncharacterized protein n=1 Tax=Mycolicibacterium doricum TaxID=126673 RepID=A0A1X1T6U1_9MYCO|nr:hypothetical protein [Mycolicibacterium doricum]MCV7267181.1 hypothetical protein [Mycolicibacterium doricum]ORV40301.1 hypothetical protein AWC01_12240 [Mycolicibacterium doricum]BBZ08292.1 hypothetical protein MDOR_24610 [Mycolicibacterium doricum]